MLFFAGLVCERNGLRPENFCIKTYFLMFKTSQFQLKMGLFFWTKMHILLMKKECLSLSTIFDSQTLCHVMSNRKRNKNICVIYTFKWPLLRNNLCSFLRWSVHSKKFFYFYYLFIYFFCRGWFYPTKMRWNSHTLQGELWFYFQWAE